MIYKYPDLELHYCVKAVLNAISLIAPAIDAIESRENRLSNLRLIKLLKRKPIHTWYFFIDKLFGTSGSLPLKYNDFLECH